MTLARHEHNDNKLRSSGKNMSNWERIMAGAYIDGGWMIISESTVGVDAYGYEAPEAKHDWVIFQGGEHIGDKPTLAEAKKYADAHYLLWPF